MAVIGGSIRGRCFDRTVRPAQGRSNDQHSEAPHEARPEPSGGTDAVRQRLLQPADHAGHSLEVLGRSEQPPNGYPWLAPTGRWWTFFEHDSDPTALMYGGVVVPAEVRSKLEQLLREGFAPDVILVGHELPARWEPGDPLPSLVPAAPPSTELPARQALYLPDPKKSADVAVRTAGALGKAAFAIGKSAAQIGVALGASLAQLDPVILAGVRHEDGSVTWVEVVRWTW